VKALKHTSVLVHCQRRAKHQMASQLELEKEHSERQAFAYLFRRLASTGVYSYKPLQNAGKGLIDRQWLAPS